MLRVSGGHGCQRPYHVENTGSRPITEVKQHRAWLVLRWVTTWENHVSLASSPFCFSQPHRGCVWSHGMYPSSLWSSQYAVKKFLLDELFLFLTLSSKGDVVLFIALRSICWSGGTVVEHTCSQTTTIENVFYCVKSIVA